MFSKCLILINLMRINKPIGFFLLLWPTLCSLWISNKGMPNVFILWLFVFGTLCMRSAGCIINDYIDRDIDIFVPRTRYRPIPIGEITRNEALLTFFSLILISFGIVCFFNCTTVFLAFIALILSVIYPYLKRYVYFPQLVLGVLFSWPILMTYAAICHTFNSTTWFLFIENTIWTIIYDTEYAMMDRRDDQRIGLKSLAIFFGNMDKFVIGVLQVLTIFILSIVGWTEQLPMIFYLLSVLGASIIFIWQQILIFDRDQKKCWKAFMSNNYVGMLVFLGIMLSFF